MSDFKFEVGMKVRANINGDWHAAYIFDTTTDGVGDIKYKVKRRDWNEYAELYPSELEPLGRGIIYASNNKYVLGQKIEALQGSTWYAATILEKKNRLYYIKYDLYNEWDWVGDEDLRGEAIVQTPQSVQMPTDSNNTGGNTPDVARYVVILKGVALYRVNVIDGSFHLLSPSWMNVKGMAAAGNFVFVVSDETLYRINVEDGRYESLGGGWADFKGMVAL